MIIPLAAPAPAVPQVTPVPAPLHIRKGACQKCGGHLEFPEQSADEEIRCPHCQEMTVLGDAAVLAQVAPTQETPASEPIPLPPRLDEGVPAQPLVSFSRLPLPEAPAEKGSFELRFGTFWAVRIGIVMVLTALGFAGYYAYRHYVPHLGAWGKVALLYLGSGGLLGFGAWFQRQQVRDGLRNYGQVVMAGGLAAVYFTTYVAHYIPGLRVIESALLDGFLLLGWAGFMVWLADRRRSEVMALFAVGLAWYTSLVTQVGVFTLYSNLLLTVAAVVFLVRNRFRSPVSSAPTAPTVIGAFTKTACGCSISELRRNRSGTGSPCSAATGWLSPPPCFSAAMTGCRADAA